MSAELPTLDDALTPTPDLTVLPASSVPAAFDRRHLYSPTLEVTRYSIERWGRTYDYRPGDDFEPMPCPPRGDGKAFAWWWHNVAKIPTSDFLGLTAGDEVTIQWAGGSTIPGAVVLETFRFGALVRFRNGLQDGAEMFVRRRNQYGRWYR